MARAVLASFGDVGRAVLREPLGSLIRVLVAVKFLGVVVVLVTVPLLLIFQAR